MKSRSMPRRAIHAIAFALSLTAHAFILSLFVPSAGTAPHDGVSDLYQRAFVAQDNRSNAFN